jgi:Uma2 family endonuclease
MNMKPAFVPHYSVADYEHWEGDWELIDGCPIAMSPAPEISHQYVNGALFRQLDEQLENCALCRPLQEADWRVYDDTVVRPDTVVVCYKPDDYLTKRPELIIEVLSPSTARLDETTKFELYQTEGVPYYLLVDPKKLIAKVYQLKEGKYMKVNDFVDGRCPIQLPDCTFELDFGLVFSRVRKALH